MRVVADTNTVLSAFLWGGPPKAVLDAAREGRITLHASPALLAELEDVLACALGATAQLIITRDRDLLDLNAFHSIPILAARDALAFIASVAQRR